MAGYSCILSHALGLVFLLTAIFQNVAGCQQYEKCIYEEIFNNRSYNKLIRPVINPNDTVQVKVQLVVLGLQNIIEIDGTMVTVSFFRTTWKDPMLTWNPAQFGGVTTIVVPANAVWTPDIALSNSASNFYEITYKRDFHISINYDGTLYWPFGGTLSTNCDISLQKYPFDNQSCPIQIESWLYPVSKVDLSFFDEGGLNLSRIGTNTLWVLSGNTTERVLKYNQQFRRLTFTLVFTRKPLFYYINIIIPTLLLMLVSLAVFWLPADCGEKISLAITVLLAFSVFQIVIMTSTPVNSDVVPEITQFVLAVMVLATISLLTSMGTSYISNKDPNTRAPLWLRRLCFKLLAKLMCMDIAKITKYVKADHDKIKQDVRGAENMGYNRYSHEGIEKEKSQTRRRMATDTSNTKVYYTGNKHNNPGIVYVKTLPSTTTNNNVANNNNTPHVETNHCEKHDSDMVMDIRKILNNMTKMSVHMEKKSETNRSQQEWKHIGRVVDRALFWLTLLLLVAFIMYIFLSNRV